MLIGAQPLASGPLAVALGSTYEPVYVVRGQAFNWRVRVVVGGINMTAQLTGTLDVDREEGAAGVAGFSLYMPPGTPVVPNAWTGRTVVIDYISRNRDGVVTEARLYTGRLEMPAWDPTNRVLSCDCSDQLQQRVEAMSIAEIDALVPGASWSADVFEPVDGRSRWDYATERLSSVPASLDASADGQLRLTPWAAQATPHYIFGLGHTLYNSVEIELQAYSEAVNYVEVTLDYRYSRLWQLSQLFAWTHEGMGGFVGIQGFCQWRLDSTELPTTEMVEDAITGAGLALVSFGGFELPQTMANPCGDGSPWINTNRGLWLSVTASGSVRWVQTVTERYRLELFTPAGADESARVISRESASFEIESDRAERWESERPGASSMRENVIDEARRTGALNCLLNRGSTTLISAARTTTLTWQIPTDMALDIDLQHTLELADRALAKGKCRRIQHQIDLGAGVATTALSIALMHGGGVSDPLTVPAAPDTELPPISSSGGGLGTHIGGRPTSPEYDESWLGFTGNYSTISGGNTYPRQFKARGRDIPAEYRDEATATAERAYRIGIPNDPLEL